MALWTLTPVASVEDDRWQGRTIWTEVIVEAPTAAFARQFAAEWELAEQQGRVGNETPSPMSGFLDEKLYWVRRLSADQSLHLSLEANPGSPVRRAVKG
jgi:hypothetical protein